MDNNSLDSLCWLTNAERNCSSATGRNSLDTKTSIWEENKAIGLIPLPSGSVRGRGKVMVSTGRASKLSTVFSDSASALLGTRFSLPVSSATIDALNPGVLDISCPVAVPAHIEHSAAKDAK